MSQDPLAGLRRLLLAIFLFALIGTGAELFLLEHTEGYWQKVPLVAMGLGVVTLGWHLGSRSSASLWTFRGVMGLFVAAGLAGLYWHYRGNVEFELEMYPSREGFELVWETLRGATPALAPGAMISLGLLGFAYTYRYPTTIHTSGDP